MVEAQFYPRTRGYRADVRDIEARVASIYRQYLQREPDAFGLDNWVRQYLGGQVNETQIMISIVSSPEYARLNGRTDEGFIRGLFQDYMGRQPNRFEFVNWMRVHENFGGDRQSTADHFFKIMGR